MTGAASGNHDLRALIRTIPDFPKPGILFRDVTTLLADGAGLRASVARMAEPWEGHGIDKVIGLEARGFILGGAVACHLGAGFVPVRKAGKLPGKVLTQDYALEYGSATFELHEDAIEAGETVLIVDDLLATGGTAEAGIALLERLGARIAACSFIVDLPALGGRKRLEALGMSVHTLVAFDGA
ncbi:adenine phosphoribosyltransferase [Roseovarius aquimarinus]|uniref:Adenine phosphoribosyltransferase n=1 Tax=Roseovarius aquimarinus TaxID=1229156 RepID=A0ABW7I8H5_9RHOB